MQVSHENINIYREHDGGRKYAHTLCNHQCLDTNHTNFVTSADNAIKFNENVYFILRVVDIEYT